MVTHVAAGDSQQFNTSSSDPLPPNAGNLERLVLPHISSNDTVLSLRTKISEMRAFQSRLEEELEKANTLLGEMVDVQPI